MGSQYSGSLRAMVYVSKAAIEFDPKELERLLSDARESNQKSSVTGVLLFSNGTFMQYFEGPEPGISETWNRINASKRHTGIIALLDEPIEFRLFGDWQMGFVAPGQSETLQRSSFEAKKMRSQAGARIPRPDALVILEHFWKVATSEVRSSVTR